MNNINITFKSYKNLCYIFYILFKHSLKFLFFNDKLKYIKDICVELEKFNVIYIKIIQTLCVNNFIFSKEQTDYLLKYSDHVPYTLFENDDTILNKLEEEGIYFENKEPINSGIIALVYKGRYKDTDVAIKILKKGIDQKLMIAIEDFYLLGCILYYIPLINNYNIGGLFKDNIEIICDQINFKKELINIKNWLNYSNKVDYLLVPNVYEEFTEKYNSVLVMEFIDGKKSNELTLDEKQNYLYNLAKIQLVAIFYYGIGHSDLHSGNIIFQKDKIALIDYGIGFKLDKEEQQSIYIFYKEIFINKNALGAALMINNFIYPKENFDNLDKKKQLEIIEKVSIVITKYFYEDANIEKFIYYLNKSLNSENLKMSKGFNNVIYGSSVALNFFISFIKYKSNNPNNDYNKICIEIIKDLIKETEFNLD